MIEINERDISDFFNTDFREYALYTIQNRAISCLLDALKPIQRKALWVANQRAKAHPIKTVSLAGYIIADADYKHGDASAVDAVVKMAAKWRNNVQLLVGKGNFGSRLTPEAGAPRYTKVQLAPNFHNWFSDFNALQYEPGDDGADYEPMTYHANVPWALINGIRGIATGYSSFVHPRNPENIIKLTISLLDGKVPDVGWLEVSYPEYDGIIENGYSIGQFEYKTKKKLIIHSLPVDHTLDTYANKLVKLLDKGVIRDFHKTYSAGNPPFIVDLKSPLKNPEKTLGLRRKLPTEQFVFIHNKRLVIFDDIWEYIVTFIEERLKVAERGIANSVKSRDDIINDLTVKIEFVRRLKEEGIQNLDNKQLRAVIESLKAPKKLKSSLRNMSVQQMTEETLDKWEKEIRHLQEEIDSLRAITPNVWLKYNIQHKPLS